jgi:type I restriction enzyme S subunit
VAKIEELLPLIDRYEKAWSKLEDFNKRFPVDMQKSLLQMAIQGKLVDHRPEEGTGEELYRQIQAEKQRLIKSGKIKKEKPLPEITPDEIPFDIPESWKWVRLNTIAQSIVDCPHSTPKYLNAETLYCAIDTNCINEKGDIVKWRYVDSATYQARIARLTPQKDDIVYTREGSICRAAILPVGKNICLGQRVMLVRCSEGVCPQFLRRMLMTPMVINTLTEQQKGIGAKHVNVSDVCSLTLPLPPLAEQKRIVAKLEELLPLCERLK